jgi:hypothetical protein
MRHLTNKKTKQIISVECLLRRSGPYDFFFWGCVNDKVYSSNPCTEEGLKENICREISNIPAENLQKVNQNLFRQCKECLHVERQRFKHLLWSVNKDKNFPSFQMLSAG